MQAKAAAWFENAAFSWERRICFAAEISGLSAINFSLSTSDKCAGFR